MPCAIFAAEPAVARTYLRRWCGDLATGGLVLLVQGGRPLLFPVGAQLVRRLLLPTACCCQGRAVRVACRTCQDAATMRCQT